MSSRKKFKVGELVTLKLTEENGQFKKYNNTKAELLECVTLNSKDAKGNAKLAYYVKAFDDFKFHVFDGELCLNGNK